MCGDRTRQSGEQLAQSPLNADIEMHIWEQPDWPDLTWDSGHLAALLGGRRWRERWNQILKSLIQCVASILLNCPFDDEYRPLLRAAIFTVMIAFVDEYLTRK